jgi:hypothetical protein
MKIGQDLYPYVMGTGRWKKVRKTLAMDSKVLWVLPRLVYVPFGGNTHQVCIEKSQPNQILIMELEEHQR